MHGIAQTRQPVAPQPRHVDPVFGIERLHAIDHLQDIGDAVQRFLLLGRAQMEAGKMRDVAHIFHIDSHTFYLVGAYLSLALKGG